jgi:PAS domain S-box-containing protein
MQRTDVAATCPPEASATSPDDADLHRSLFAHMVEGVAYCRMLFEDDGTPVDFIYEDVNPAFEGLTGIRDSIGRRITEAIPGIREANPELFEIYGRVTRTGIPEQFETYVPGLGRWFSVRAFRPQPEHFAAVFENITERKLGEQALRASEARMRGALDVMHDPFLVCASIRSVDGTITGFRAVFANRAAEAFMGRMPDTLSGSPMPERMPFLGAAPFFETFRIVVETGEAWSQDGVEFMVPGRDGSPRTGLIDIQVARFEDGFFATWRDVSERAASAEALRQSEHRFRQFFERTPDYVFMVSLDGHVIDANAAALEALGYAHDELVGRSVETIYAPESRGSMAELFERWSETGPIANLEQVLLTREGERRTVLLSASMVRDGGGRPLYFLGVQRDIAELREAQADADLELRISAVLTESLQSIPDGAGVKEAAQVICDQLATLPFVDTATVQAFLGARDVQNIAQNAPVGYPVPVGTFLPPIRAALVREQAAVGPWAEYVSEDPADGWMPGTISSGLKALAFGPIGHGDHVAGVLALGTLDERFARTLVEKMPGIVSFSTTLSALLAARLNGMHRQAELRDGLAAVLASAAFHPVFQPIVDLGGGEVVGYEALTRFDSGQRPDLCFADAWSVGLGPEMELATLEAAVKAGKLLPPGVWLNLNVSPRLLADPERLRPVLWGAGRPLVLEVTEHDVIEDYEMVRNAIASLGRDIRLAVDDAGAGVANFGHIIDLRPDFVKLDISLVRRVNANLGRQAMVVGMRHFSRTAGCRLIAEGVETMEEARTLTALGVEFAQGYHFGYPEPVERWVAERDAGADRGSVS